MNFLSLEYFLAVEKTRNFTAAAEKLYVSQQSLSEYIKKLETEIGAQLLVRKRPLELTEAGEIFAAAAEEILTIKHNMTNAIADCVSKDNSRLTLGISTYEAPPFFPGLLAWFSKHHPHIEVDIVKRREDNLDDKTAMEGISFYIGTSDVSSSKLENIYFIRNDCNCIVARRSLFEKTFGEQWPAVSEQLRRTGDLTLVKELPFALLKDRKGRMLPYTTDVFDSFGMTPNVGFQSDNGDLNSALCLQGDAARLGPLYIMSTRFEKTLNQGDDPMMLFPIRTKRNSVTLTFSYRKEQNLNPVQTCFLEETRGYMDYMEQRFKGTQFDVDTLEPFFFYD